MSQFTDRYASDPEYKAHRQKYVRERNARVRKEDPWPYVLSVTKTRCKKLGIPYNLTTEYIKQLDVVDVCPVLGEPLVRGDYNWAPSIDRIVPADGYVRGNVQIISRLANRMKQDATPDQLVRFADWVYENYVPVVR